MRVYLSYVIGRLSRLFPKTTMIKKGILSGRFFVPFYSHYVSDDLRDLHAGRREPKLYQWLAELPDSAVYFDIGTSYGQEVTLASSLIEKNIAVVGFDCALFTSHFCALNKKLNGDRFRFVFAAVGKRSGDLITITSNSDTHIPTLHKKNVPYSYDVPTIALDDFCRDNHIQPTHIKIDVDGAEAAVLAGAKSILSGDVLQGIFIERDHEFAELEALIESHGFVPVWRHDKAMNSEIIYKRQS